MPGLLKPNAVCPLCELPLVAIVDTTSTEGVTREYFHGPEHPDCKQFFASHVVAATERDWLEGRTQ